MPNPLIYASTTPNHSLHKGGVAVGVNSVEYNPSDGWVNGAIPTDWDYVIYKTTSGANPNIFAPINEQEFYNFVLMQGGSASDTTSVGAALAWIATQSDLLAIENPFNNMVTDGLVLALDAGNVSSYPTTGNTWYDLSGVGNNGTLTNGPTFNSNGWFEFDGTDDKILSGGTMDAAFTTQHWTVNIQFNIDAGYSSYNAMLGNGYPFQLYVFNGKVVAYLSSTAGSSTYFLSGMTSTQTISTGKWYDLAFVRDGTNYYYYINSTLDQSATSTTATIAAANQNLQIGNLWNANYSYAWEGKIGNVKIYSESLTLSQIKQNYYGAPDVPNNPKIVVNRAQKGVTVTDSGIGVDLARVYDNTQTWGYANSDLNGDFDGLTNFTYFLWLHCYSHHTNYSQTPFYKYAGTTTAVVRLYDFGNYNGNNAQANNRFYANRNGSWGSISDNFTMAVGETACICLQYDSSGGDLWKNGVKTGTNVGGGTIATNTSALGIITPEYGGEQYLKVKEAYVYTETLTDSEILDLYNATRGKYNV